MLEFLQRLFSSDELTPHGRGYFWPPGLVWLHAVSEGLIAASYMALPLTLIYFLRRRRDFPFPRVLGAFALFLVWCGVAHAVEIWTLWSPAYWLSGPIKALTAAASVATAVLLVRLVPRALELPSSEAIRSTHEKLASSHARFRAAADGMTDAFYIFDAVSDGIAISDFRLVEANEIGLSRLRRSREEAIGHLYTELYVKIRSSGLLDRFIRVFTAAEPFDSDFQVKDASINVNWVHMRVVPLEAGIAITSSEITERRQLQRERELYTTVVASMSEGLCLVRAADGVIVFTNPKFDKMLGYEAGELKGKLAKILLDPSDPGAPAVAADLMHRIREGGEVSYEVRNSRKDKSTFLCRATASMIRDEDHGDVVVVVQADITEQKRSEEISHREQQLKILAETIPQIVWTSNPEGDLDYYNQRWFDYTGMTLEETRGWGWKPVLHPDDLLNCTERWSEAVRTGDDYEVEYRFKRASDGAYRWHLGRARPVRDFSGAIVKWFGTCTDIDDQRRAQDVLLEARDELEERVARRTSELAASQEAVASSEARFRAAANGMTSAFYIMNAVRDKDGQIRDFRVMDCNGAAERRFKRTRGDLLGALHSTLVPEALANGLYDRLARLIGGVESHEEVIEVESDGARTAWRLHVVPIDNGIAVTSTDITERRKIEEERNLHAAVIASINEGVCLVRASDRMILYANPKLAWMFGYEEHEMEGKTTGIFRPLVEDAAAKEYIEWTVQQVAEKGIVSYETINAHKDGRGILVRGTTTTLRSEEYGEVWVVVKEDITEQRRLEEERDGFFMLSSDMLCVVGSDGYFKQLNPAWVRTLGWSLSELRARPRLDLVHPDDKEGVMAERVALASGQTIATENRYLGKDGQYRVLQWRSVPSPTLGDIFAVARDITDLREAAEAVKASLAEKEILLKEIHHRVKNNLQVISSLLKLHGEQITDPVAKSAFSDSQDRVRSIALLHEKLYQSKNLGAVSAAEYTESLVQTLMRTHGRVAPARVTVDAPGIALPVDLAVPCGIILNELITNALKHAFPPNRDRSPEIHIAMSSDSDDKNLIVSVNDNGVGLPPDFDLAKSQTLGMHLVRTLARQLRAQVTMTVGEGTHWRFRFSRQAGGEA